MAVQGPKAGIGKYVYRLYAFGYVAILGFGLLGDLAGQNATEVHIAPRTTATAAVAVMLAIAIFGLGGRRAVALRPTPAEMQLAVMSPMPRRITLARATGFGATSGAIAGAAVALAMMLTSAKQFGGLTVAIQLGYVAFAAGIGLVVFGAHLLFAERRGAPVFVVAVALGAASVADAVQRTTKAPVTILIESLRHGAPALAVLTPWVVGIALIAYANVSAERLPMEMVNRGSDLADRATVALVGNDLRSLLLLQRSIGADAWRRNPRIRLPKRLARKFPVAGRGARSLLRWRLPRIVFVIACAAGASALLRTRPASVRTVALSALLLWALGLAFGEPLAQEHDKENRLNLLPQPLWIEYRHIMVSWTCTFVVLGASLSIALKDRATAATVVALAVSATCAATAAGTTTYRKPWKSVVGGALAFMPEVGAIRVVFSVLFPALIAVACVSGWIRGTDPGQIAAPGVLAFGYVLAWIKIGPGVRASFAEASEAANNR